MRIIKRRGGYVEVIVNDVIGKGNKKMTAANGSLNSTLQTLAVGQYVFVESTVEDFLNVIRRVTAKKRFPASMKDFKFSCDSYTAVGCKKLGDIKYLVRIERVE